MKMKNMELIEHINGLTEMIGEGPNLRVRLSHLINRNYGALVEAYRPYEEDLRKIKMQIAWNFCRHRLMCRSLIFHLQRSKTSLSI